MFRKQFTVKVGSAAMRRKLFLSVRYTGEISKMEMQNPNVPLSRTQTGNSGIFLYLKAGNNTILQRQSSYISHMRVFILIHTRVSRIRVKLQYIFFA